MKDLQQIKEKLQADFITEAIEDLNLFISENPNSEEAFFLRGNAYRRLNNWKMAVSDYSCAKQLNPNGAGARAYDAAIEVLNFFNTDNFNP